MNEVPKCTCADRGDPDWNGYHDGACPWLSWAMAKPSIAELQRLCGMTTSTATRKIADSAPVLLDIVAAALAWRSQRAENLYSALMRSDAEIEAEEQDVSRARVKRTADLARALEMALSKVRP